MGGPKSALENGGYEKKSYSLQFPLYQDFSSKLKHRKVDSPFYFGIDGAKEKKTFFQRRCKKKKVIKC